jgi:3-methyladenine DNA glycosylase AlkD
VSVVERWVDATREALQPLADPERAEPMAAYMKDVAPFLGIQTPARRAAQRGSWRPLPRPTPDEVAEIARELWALPEREYAYAACDLLAREQSRLPATFLADPVEALITDRPWWDTVDSLGSAVVSPLTVRYPTTVDLMWAWLESGDRWLIRAAIQHQRGRRSTTDVRLLLAMCDPFVTDREFFIAKAIGWALRDLTAWDAPGVQRYVDEHPDLSSVARREAMRGLTRAALR